MKESHGPGIKIPKDDVVKFVIKEGLQQRKALSQNELSRTIATKLAKGDRKYRISGKRARLLALDAGAHVHVETRKGPLPKRCPVCGHTLKKHHTKNLAGRKVISRIDCSKCGFFGSGGRWAPKRYIFSI